MRREADAKAALNGTAEAGPGVLGTAGEWVRAIVEIRRGSVGNGRSEWASREAEEAPAWVDGREKAGAVVGR